MGAQKRAKLHLQSVLLVKMQPPTWKKLKHLRHALTQQSLLPWTDVQRLALQLTTCWRPVKNPWKWNLKGLELELMKLVHNQRTAFAPSKDFHIVSILRLW